MKVWLLTMLIGVIVGFSYFPARRHVTPPSDSAAA
jgi:hypothetical protein